jgi:hypothetical protein
MAGSISWFDYQGDNNIRYALKMDKSNGTAQINGKPLMLVRAAGALASPSGLKKRYAYAYSQANPRIKRRFWVGNPAAVADVLAGGFNITAEDYPAGDDKPGASKTWVITAYRGERSSPIPAASATDTGLTDS